MSVHVVEVEGEVEPWRKAKFLEAQAAGADLDRESDDDAGGKDEDSEDMEEWDSEDEEEEEEEEEDDE